MSQINWYPGHMARSRRLLQDQLRAVDAVIELDVRLYEEQELELLQDLYATNREIVLDTGEAVFDQILTRNFGKCRVAEKVEMETDPGCCRSVTAVAA